MHVRGHAEDERRRHTGPHPLVLSGASGTAESLSGTVNSTVVSCGMAERWRPSWSGRVMTGCRRRRRRPAAENSRVCAGGGGSTAAVGSSLFWLLGLCYILRYANALNHRFKKKLVRTFSMEGPTRAEPAGAELAAQALTPTFRAEYSELSAEFRSESLTCPHICI